MCQTIHHPKVDPGHAADTLASTSLVPKGKSVPDRCPRTHADVVCRQHPDRRFPAGCDTWSCRVCGPALAWRKAQLITWAEPERFVTLTQAPGDWQRCRAKVRKLRMRIAGEGYKVHWAWTVERGKRTGMIHVHLLQHGSYIPQRDLQAWWGRRVDVRKINHAARISDYVLKEAARVAGYTMKGTNEDLARHLDLNGGRGLHTSRGYLRGKTSDEVWKILHPPDPALDWLLVPAGESYTRSQIGPQRPSVVNSELTVNRTD